MFEVPNNNDNSTHYVRKHSPVNEPASDGEHLYKLQCSQHNMHVSGVCTVPQFYLTMIFFVHYV